jgi:hypothetical protein
MVTELDDLIKGKWYKIVFGIKKHFGKKPDLNGILFLIGVNELGQVREFSKQEKTDLMHIAMCKLLSYKGYYKLINHDCDGWPHYDLVEKPSYVDLGQQETLLKQLIVQYFEEKNILETY